MAATGDLLHSLVDTNEGDPELDKRVAVLLGFVENGSSWSRPDGAAIRTLPRFTSDIQDAIDLSTLITNANISGVSWEPGLASAVLGDQKPYQAKTAACAICISVLAYHLAAIKGEKC
jgi:hypothetical protein